MARIKEFFTSRIHIDPDKADKWMKTGGILLAILALFTLISVVSYFFTWKTDQSLLLDPDMMDKSEEVANLGGKAGLRWADFLVAKSFGIASLGVVAFISLLAAWMLKRPSKISLGRLCLLSLTGVVLFSIILALISPLAGASNAFGSGLGGRAGAALISSSVNLIGLVVTAILTLLLTVGYLMLLSPRFSRLLFPKEDPGDPSIDMDGPEEAGQAISEEDDNYEQNIENIAISEDLEPEIEPEPAEEGSFTVTDDDTIDVNVQSKEPLPRIDNRADLPLFKFPPVDILGDYESMRHIVSRDELERNNLKIRNTLANYRIDVRDVEAVVGPTVTLYKVYPAPGVKIASIKNLQEDIAMSLNARGVRIVTLSDSVGIEVANDKPSIVPLKALLKDPAFIESKYELPVAIGYTITQKVKVFDLSDAPHLLVAGATKQGKSVGLNVIVSSLLYAKHPSELKFVFIDPKMVEFSAYGNLLYHYLAVLPSADSEQEEMEKAIVKNAKDAATVLKSLCVEMDERYELLSKAGVNNIKRYNDKYRDRHLLPTDGHKFLPYIVTVIDEYADLTMSTGAGPESKALSRSIMTSVIRLAQKGRAAGLHVILATQRPTVDVVTGLIKTNFPMRIAFRVTSRVDSATILDSPGADKLIGKGDMLIYSGIETERVQCGYVDGDEITEITEYIGDQRGYKKSYNTPYYLPEPEPESTDEGGGMVDMKNLDERFEEAARLVVTSQRGSTSDLQRRLGMGYAKAGRVMDQLEAAGVVGPQQGSKPREVLVKDFNELDELLSHFLQK